MHSILLAPSILSADFSRLGEEIRAVENAGADVIHVDVMDGHFVPNITIGPLVVKAAKAVAKRELDVHLMITDPGKYIESFAKAGADWITVHVEACTHLHRVVGQIKQCGLKAGVVLNPATSLASLEYILDDVDIVMLMSVNPGFGGQKFIPSTLNKIYQLRKMIEQRGLDVGIEIDGGISPSTIKDVAAAGANIFVAGSAIYGTADYAEAISTLRRLAQQGLVGCADSSAQKISAGSIRNSLESAKASVKLRQLAERPYDLALPNALMTDRRMQNFICKNKIFQLLYAAERIDEKTVAALQELADECGLVEQFKEMRRGAVKNRIEGVASENRQVLHTACRDIFIDTPAEPAATAQAQEELSKLKLFLDEVDAGLVKSAEGRAFDTLLHIGIGGSDLGPRSIVEALKLYGKSGRKVHFISNVDPDDAARVLQEVDLRTCLICIVSKSGTTLETLTNEQLVTEKLRQLGLDPAKHCLAVTGKGSPMDNPAKYLRSFYMFDYIGGRFSSTSMVGAVSLAFYLGFDHFLEFLRGASIVDNEAECADITKNVPLLLAMLGIWNHNFLGAATLAILPYSQALHRFPAHLQQCDMESNGKSITRVGKKPVHATGPILFGEPGTNGQHAFYQLLHQGTEIVPIEFIGFRNNQAGKDCLVDGTSSQEKLLANMLAQSVAFACGQKNENPNKIFPGNRPSCILMADKLTPLSMGALLALYEAKIVFQGFCWNINSFDQEGVQLGKILATRILDHWKKGETTSVESPEIELAKMAIGRE